MIHPTTMLRVLAASLAFATFAPAQNGDPMREIQEIARRVDEQLREIDRLLLESGKKNQERSKPKEMLQQARERSQAVEEGIDQLIEKLQQMKQQSSSSSQEPQDGEPGQDGQQGQQPQSGQQRQGNRRENQTPDFVQQPRGEGEPKPDGQQPQPKPGGEQPGGEQPQPQPGQPTGGQEIPTGGENTVGNRPDQTPSGPGNPGQGEGSWGELQPYLNLLKNRGSAPKVPEKYRKYWEAYLKQKQGQGGTPGRPEPKPDAGKPAGGR